METTQMRVGHAERESVIDVLQSAYAEGRLDTEELDQRVHLAMTSKTRGDLEPLTHDLAPRPALEAEETGEDKVLGSLAHVTGMLTTFIGPLVLLLTSGRRSAPVRAHAVEALNFQLTLLIFTIVTFGIGGVVYAVAWIASLIAGLSALTSGSFRYPLTLRLIK
ncbi:hypothetical protein GCM10022221_51380 [Actinocorallia aurea]